MQGQSLFLAGVPKSGTSAVVNWLGQHPDVVVSRPKEPNYFNTDLPLGLCADDAQYLSYFRVAVGRAPRVRCDGSILYGYSAVAAQRIARACPAARVVIVVRDPVEVMHAWHGQMRYTGNEPIADFDAALGAEARRAAGSRRGLVGLAARCPALLCYRRLAAFAEQIERFYGALGRESVLVLTHDEMLGEPHAAYAAVLRHAGLDDAHRPNVRRMNEFKERRWLPLHRAVKRCAAAPSRRLLAPFLRQRLIRGWDRLTSRDGRRPPIDPELRHRLAEELRPEVQRLAALIGRDLSRWCSPSSLAAERHAASSVSDG